MDFAAAIGRRKWHQHWYRPGNDTPLGYFVGRFAFLALLVAGLPTAVLGRGWHVLGEYVTAAVVDGTWMTTRLIRKYRKGRRLPLGPGTRGERWIDTPESRAGIPLD
jgi:hypothetical protein